MSLIVSDDNLGQLRRQLGGLGDNPHTGFGTLVAAHHAADIIAIDAHRGALLATQVTR
jgi:hypothetical protein